MRIRLFNRFDVFGGAEMVAMQQLRLYNEAGHDVRFLVGEKRSSDPLVHQISCDMNLDRWRKELADVEILHFHNLHGNYFDMDILPELSWRTVVFATLHDQFLLTGGCVHNRGCARWATGCGDCPQKEIGMDNGPDGTAAQWIHKRATWASSRLHVVSPALWLHHRARESILATSGATSFYHLPNGVDTREFTPDLRSHARAKFGQSPEERILLTVGVRLRSNPSKDWDLLRMALADLVLPPSASVTLFVVGDGKPRDAFAVGGVRVRFFGHVTDRRLIAEIYAASDVYIQASQVETFSLAILEAMASGCAVVATDVGGAREQIGIDEDSRCGLVVPLGDTRALRQALDVLLTEASMCRRLGTAARARAMARYSLTSHICSHLARYEESLRAQLLVRRHPRSAA